MPENSSILFLACGKNQLNAIRAAHELGYRTIGIDNDPKCPGKDFLDMFYEGSSRDLSYAKNVFNRESPEVVISFSPGMPCFVAQEVKTTIGQRALEILSDRVYYNMVLEKAGILVPKFVTEAWVKDRDARSCGGSGICLENEKLIQENIFGYSLYIASIFKDGNEITQLTFFKTANGFEAYQSIASNLIKHTAHAIDFKSGVLVVETISGAVVDVGIECEPQMIEKMMNYKEVFDVFR